MTRTVTPTKILRFLLISLIIGIALAGTYYWWPDSPSEKSYDRHVEILTQKARQTIARLENSPSERFIDARCDETDGIDCNIYGVSGPTVTYALAEAKNSFNLSVIALKQPGSQVTTVTFTPPADTASSK